MLAASRRHLLVIALLVLAVAATWGLRWALEAGQPKEISAQTLDPGSTPPAGSALSTPEAGFVYFADVEGWYRITPYETALRSPYDWTADSTQKLGAALPSSIEGWQQVGPDQDVVNDPSIVYYLGHPTVALRRSYIAPDGLALTLSVIGNKGDDSFLLFSHTPETCYPGRLWQVVEARRESAQIDDRPMHVQYLLTQHAETGQKLMVLYWYLWDNPQRDAGHGVLSVRVNLIVPPGQDEQAILSRAWEFIRTLFPATVAWNRF